MAPFLEAEGLSSRLCIISPNAVGDVVADEQAIIQTMLDISPKSADAVNIRGRIRRHARQI